MQDRSHAQQQQRAQGLNLVVAAIVLWNTLELARAIAELQSEGVEMTAEQLRHLSPMDWEHIGLTGEYTWDFALKNARSWLSVQKAGLDMLTPYSRRGLLSTRRTSSRNCLLTSFSALVPIRCTTSSKRSTRLSITSATSFLP